MWSKKDIRLFGQDQKIKLVRIVADGKGRLFVNDANNIQMFSVSDGQYVGCLMGEEGLGQLGQMCFHESMSQLVVSHSKDNKIFIVLFNVE